MEFKRIPLVMAKPAWQLSWTGTRTAALDDVFASDPFGDFAKQAVV
jgi:hypothetical protein